MSTADTSSPFQIARGSVGRVIFALVLLLAILDPCRTAIGQVTDGFHFLNLNPGGRISGLGGYHAVFLQGGLSEAEANPAYIAFNDSLAFHFSVSRHPGGLTSTHASLVSRLAGGSASGGSVAGGGTGGGGELGRDGVGFGGSGEPRERIGYVAIRSLGYGEFERRDEVGTQLGGLRAVDAEVVAGTARRLSSRITVGLTASFIHSRYAEYHSSAIAAKGGLLWMDRPGRTAAGITLRNVGTTLYGFTPESPKETLPLRWAVGVTHKPEYVGVRLMLTLEGSRSFEKKPFVDLIGGTEFLLSENARLRIGYHSGIHRTLKLDSRLDFSGVHAGFGLRTGNFRLDIARTSWGQLGGITQLGISIPLKGSVSPF